MPSAVELLGIAAAEAGDRERAAVLAGIAHRMRREVGRSDTEYQPYRPVPAGGPGGPGGPGADEHAYRRGYRLSRSAAIDFALGTEPARTPAGPARAAEAVPLTRREYEVARLIGEGLC